MSNNFKITTLWVVDQSDPDRMPYLLEAYDELTEDSHGGTPDFFEERLRKLAEQGNDEWRIVPIHIDYVQVRAAFHTAPIEGDVAVEESHD